MSSRAARLGRLSPPTLFLLSALAVLATAAFAQDGFADPTFGNLSAGFSRAFFDLGGDWRDAAAAVAALRDGRIVLAGSAEVAAAPFAGDVALALLHNDGTLDGNFNFSGQLHFDLLDLELDDALTAVGELSDGTLVAAGVSRSASNSYPIVVLVTQQGIVLDERIFGFPSYAGFAALAVQPDDKIVLAGWVNRNANYAFLVMRLLPDLGRDFGFGVNGEVKIDFDLTPPTYDDDAANAVVVQEDGKIVVAGEATYGNQDSDMAVARLLANGAPDAGFGGGTGRVTVFFDLSATEKRDAALGVALDAFGRITLAGCAQMDSAPFSRAALARLNPGGDADLGFGNLGNGRAAFPSLDSSLTCSTAVAVQSNARIVFAGSAYYGVRRFAAGRLTSTGQLDADWGGGFGVVSYNVYYGGAPDDGLAIALDAGRALVAGRADVSSINNDTDFAVMRLTSSLVFADGFENSTTNQWSATSP